MCALQSVYFGNMCRCVHCRVHVCGKCANVSKIVHCPVHIWGKCVQWLYVTSAYFGMVHFGMICAKFGAMCNVFFGIRQVQCIYLVLGRYCWTQITMQCIAILCIFGCTAFQWVCCAYFVHIGSAKGTFSAVQMPRYLVCGELSESAFNWMGPVGKRCLGLTERDDGKRPKLFASDSF